MLIKNLHTDHILTLSDYPVHNQQVLKLYHRMFWKGHQALVPSLPVVQIDAVCLGVAGNSPKKKHYNEILSKFLSRHPKVKYCLVDGSHKSTAASLCKKNIKALILQNDADIREARKMVEKGELLSLTTGGTDTIDGALAVLRNHFFTAMRFETVGEKTRRMIRDKIIPRYMIREYRRINE